MPKKLEISYHYLDLCHEKSPGRPSQRDLAVRAKISTRYARKVIIELTNTGSLTDPEVTNSERLREAEKILYLDPVEELFLLALRAEKPARSNTDYVAHIFTYYGTLVSASFISLWFKHGSTIKALSESRILFHWTSSSRTMLLGTLSSSSSVKCLAITHVTVSWTRNISSILTWFLKNNAGVQSPGVPILFL
jgi:hypothetical protein